MTNNKYIFLNTAAMFTGMTGRENRKREAASFTVIQVINVLVADHGRQKAASDKQGMFKGLRAARLYICGSEWFLCSQEQSQATDTGWVCSQRWFPPPAEQRTDMFFSFACS